MGARRKLSDLYQVGRELDIDDGMGEPVRVWLQKLNSVQHADAVRRSDARRARVLAIKRRPESDEYMSLLGSVFGLTDDEKVEYLLIQQTARLRPKREAEVAAEEEWSKDNYLDGLREDWTGDDGVPGLNVRFEDDPNDVEAKRVFEELKRYTIAVQELVDYDTAEFRRDYERMSAEELEKEVVENLLEIQSNTEWLNEFNLCQIWLGVRSPENHKEMYFENRSEVDELATAALSEIRRAYDELSVEVLEGKDLPGVLDSSHSSGPSNEEAISPSSGLVTVSG